MKLPRIAHTIVIICAIVCASITPHPVMASISTCAATVDMDSVPAETTNSFTFTVTNNTDNAEGAAWIKLTVPSGNFIMAGSPSSPGWSNSNDSSSMTMTGGSVDAGETYTFSIQVTSANVTADAANWGIQVSADGGGADATSCSGSLGTAITGGGGDTQFPEISALTVTDIGATSARVTWTTNEAATSVLQYGTTGDYGATKTDASMTTSHSVTIDSLTALTTYHYSVQSTDAAGNTGDSGENTFVTNAASSTTTTSTTGSVRTITASPTPTPIPDRIGPGISLKTMFDAVYTAPPRISGNVSDASGVSSIEYSLDGGVNFVPVDGISSFGKTSIPFSFEPYQTDDGTYVLVFRGVDSKGNISTKKSATYTIDRMPPQFGASIVTFGAQVLEPDGLSYQLITHLEYAVTASVIGGPTQMHFTVENERGEVAEVPAKRNSDTGLWKAVLEFDQPGMYTLFGTAIDGAQNKTVTERMKLTVLPSAMAMDADAKPVDRAELTIFSLDTSTQTFVKWDGRSYGQKNPYITSETGSFGFVLPKGTYYLQARAFGYKTVISDIFSVERITPITQQVTLTRSFGLQIGKWLIPLFDFSQTHTTLNIQHSNIKPAAGNTITGPDAHMPFFRFPYNEKFISSLDLRGKPTLITMLNTWSPITASQLSVLDALAAVSTINLLVIVPQESTASVATFMKRGAYEVRIVADPDGALISPIAYTTSPTHIIVDRKGIVTSVITGLVTKEKILDTIIE